MHQFFLNNNLTYEQLCTQNIVHKEISQRISTLIAYAIVSNNMILDNCVTFKIFSSFSFLIYAHKHAKCN